MAEINPYEPPKTRPSKTVATAKKGLAFVTLAILSPIAVVIAGGCSCLATGQVVMTMAHSKITFIDQGFVIFVVGSIVFLVPPLTVMFVMGRWAIRAYNREVEEHNAKLRKRPPYVE